MAKNAVNVGTDATTLLFKDLIWKQKHGRGDTEVEFFTFDSYIFLAQEMLF